MIYDKWVNKRNKKSYLVNNEEWHLWDKCHISHYDIVVNISSGWKLDIF